MVSVNSLLAYFGNKNIRNIKTSDLETYKSYRLKMPVEVEINQKIQKIDKVTGKKTSATRKVKHTSQRKASSVNRELETLRAMLNFAIENDWLITNPFAKKKGIISKASEIERDRTLSIEEESQLLIACVDRREHIRPIVICALDTAMRRGEMFLMRWRYVNLTTDTLFN